MLLLGVWVYFTYTVHWARFEIGEKKEKLLNKVEIILIPKQYYFFSIDFNTF